MSENDMILAGAALMILAFGLITWWLLLQQGE